MITGAYALLPWGLGVTLLGILGYLLSRRVSALTPAGGALLDQIKGFRLYLMTAELDQLRHEELEALSTRNLPYAIALGLARRWIKRVRRPAARRAREPCPGLVRRRRRRRWW